MSKVADDESQRSLTLAENTAIISKLFVAEAKEKRIARQVVWLQIVAVLAAGGFTCGMEGALQLTAAVLSGGGISVLNGAMLAWRMSRAALHSAQDTHIQLRLMYFYAAERFLIVVVLLGLCLALLRLSPPAVLGGFVMGQAVLLIARFKRCC